jgi:hypothetical protein
MITKEQVLSKVSTYDILAHFLRPYFEQEGHSVQVGVHVYVPEISGEQKTPSFNIYLSRRSGEYRYKDFVGHDGSAFDFVMNLYNVSFPKSLSIINREMNLGLEGEEVEAVKVDYKKPEPKPAVQRNYSYKLVESTWTKKHLRFWSKYGTSLKTLKLFGWKPVKSLDFYNKKNEPVHIEDRGSSVIFAWERNSWGKYYMPEIKDKNGIIIQKKGFGYFGHKQEDYVFGLEQLPPTADDLYLVGGEKDTTNMRSHGKYAVCLNSEESSPKNYPKFIELIESDRFKNCMVMMDNDKVGRRRMLDISSEIPKLKMKVLDIPDGWDVSDMLMDKYSKLMF